MKVSGEILTKSILGLVVCAAIAALAAPAIGVGDDAPGYSHVRIVRLSFAEGTVTVQRAGSADWSTATANTPLEEGMKVATGDDGFAEIEFENGSTARIGQLSTIVFTQLALMPSGGKVNHLTLERGYATFNIQPEGDDAYEVKAGNAVFTPGSKSEFRIDIDNLRLRAEVFRGTLGTLDPSWSGTLARNDVLALAPNQVQASGQPYNLTQGITKDDWDKWVAERDSLQAQTGGGPLPTGSPGLYGWNDLYQYGDWRLLPGYGYGWFPDVAYGWAPYTMGRWAFYPGFGPTWISAEPWGWLPYHCGGWMDDPTWGWFWAPGMGGCMDWSPALVTWYQGPGWTGWSPLPPRGPGRVIGGKPPIASPCPRCKTPIAVVKTREIAEGKWIQLNGYKNVNLAHARGEPVPRLNVQPTRVAKLPGDPASAPTARSVVGWEIGARGEPAAIRPHTFGTPAPSPATRWGGGAMAGAGAVGRPGQQSGRSSGFSSFSSSGRGGGYSGSHASSGGYGGGGGHASSGGWGGGHASGGGYSGGHSGGGGGYSGGGGGGGGHSGGGGGISSSSGGGSSASGGGGGGHH